MKARCCSAARSISAWSTLSKLSLRCPQASRCVFIPLTLHFSINHEYTWSAPPPPLPSPSYVILSRHHLPLSRGTSFSPLTRLYNHALASPLRFRAFLGSTDIHGEFNSRVFTWNSCFDQRAPLLDAIESFAIHVNGNAAHRSCSWKMKAGGSAK